MRYLSKGQKRILKDYAKDNYFNSDLLINKFNNKVILMMQLEKVNDYETLWSDVEEIKEEELQRFINNYKYTNNITRFKRGQKEKAIEEEQWLELVKELVWYNDTDIVSIDYDNGMGMTIEYWEEKDFLKEC